MVKLLIISVICFIFMGGEFAGGYISGSLAIMTDAAHMLSDVAGFMISYFAIHMGSRPSTFNMSFGYHRAEILGAMASIVLIWGLVVWLMIEAVERLVTPTHIDGLVMLITAIVGLFCNIVNIFTLHNFCGGKHDHHDHHHIDEEQMVDPAERKLSHCHTPYLQEMSRKASSVK
jgi:zinc transporter 2